MADPAVERLLDQRVAQGLPRQVTDRRTLAKVAAVITTVVRRRKEAEHEAAA